MTSPTSVLARDARSNRRPPTLVVVVAGAALTALVGLVVPAAGHQLSVSLARQPGTWTELYFTDAQTSPGAARCAMDGGDVTTRFSLVSRETGARDVDYRVEVRPVRGGEPGVARVGTRTVGAGETTVVSASLQAPSPGDQQVVVTLPGSGAEISTRCERS